MTLPKAMTNADAIYHLERHRLELEAEYRSEILHYPAEGRYVHGARADCVNYYDGILTAIAKAIDALRDTEEP